MQPAKLFGNLPLQIILFLEIRLLIASLRRSFVGGEISLIGKPVMGSGRVEPVKGKPVIGEPVTGSGIADERLRAGYKRAATAAVSTAVSKSP